MLIASQINAIFYRPVPVMEFVYSNGMLHEYMNI